MSVWPWYLAGLAAGLLQPTLAGWREATSVVMLPALAVVLTLSRQGARQALLVAVLAGVAWDVAAPSFGAALVALPLATTAVAVVERQWLPARGGPATALLAGGLVLMVRVLLAAMSAFTATAGVGAWWWLAEAAITGGCAALWWRYAQRRLPAS